MSGRRGDTRRPERTGRHRTRHPSARGSRPPSPPSPPPRRGSLLPAWFRPRVSLAMTSGFLMVWALVIQLLGDAPTRAQTVFRAFVFLAGLVGLASLRGRWPRFRPPSRS